MTHLIHHTITTYTIIVECGIPFTYNIMSSRIRQVQALVEQPQQGLSKAAPMGRPLKGAYSGGTG